jgi:DNA-binding CsgD family transcriptional regulator
VCDVLLSEAEQSALRFVLTAEPLAGRPLPSSDVLQRLAVLVPSDTIGATLADQDGHAIEEVELHGYSASGDAPGCAGPLRIGVVHWSRIPSYARVLRASGLSDSVALGFRSGKDRVVQLWWDRRTGEFSPRDVAVLTMIAPAVQRLVRDATTPALPTSLTNQERRVLMLVAAGCSNGEIAQRMDVATCTVRKHLEHAYRKLGVTNRLAAAVALRGEALPGPEVRERVRVDL